MEPFVCLVSLPNRVVRQAPNAREVTNGLLFSHSRDLGFPHNTLRNAVDTIACALEPQSLLLSQQWKRTQRKRKNHLTAIIIQIPAEDYLQSLFREPLVL